MAKNRHKDDRSTPTSSLTIKTLGASAERMAAKVLLSCELESVRLRSCNSESSENPGDLTGPFTLKFSDPVARAVGVNGPHLITEASIDLESFDSSERKKLVFRCAGTFQLEYHLEDDFLPTREEMEAFAETFTVFNAWPYIRETLQSITQRMGFNPPPLPLLRLVPPNVKATRKKVSVHLSELLEG